MSSNQTNIRLVSGKRSIMFSLISESGLGIFWKPVEINIFHVIVFFIIIGLIIFFIYRKVKNRN